MNKAESIIQRVRAAKVIRELQEFTGSMTTGGFRTASPVMFVSAVGSTSSTPKKKKRHAR